MFENTSSLKIMVTGGAGFIASHVVDAYIAAGHQVTVIDNLSSGKRENLNPQAKFIEVDITDTAKIQAVILAEQPEVINHHAAHILVGHSVQDPQFDAQANIMGLLNIMEAARQIPIKKLIFAATGGAMYGNTTTPFSETMRELPESPYGVSKRAGELYLNYYHKQYQIPYISLRYSNVYGPRQNPHGESGVIAIFSELLAQGKQPVINGDGSNTRDYVYATDVAQANLLALTSDFVGELNIGTRTEISTNEVYDKVATELGVSAEKQYGPARAGDVQASSLDCSKAKQVLGWEPQVGFDEGVKQVAEWYKSR
jgi:UDP-glucose 4-epimerase